MGTKKSKQGNPQGRFSYPKLHGHLVYRKEGHLQKMTETHWLRFVQWLKMYQYADVCGFWTGKQLCWEPCVPGTARCKRHNHVKMTVQDQLDSMK